MTPHLRPIAVVPDHIPPANQYYPMRSEPSRRARGMRTRTRILALLAGGPMTGPAIAEAVGMHPAPINRQLTVLEGGGHIERCGNDAWAQLWRLVPDREAA